jgi:DNA-3-methyladenine glycosylase I
MSPTQPQTTAGPVTDEGAGGRCSWATGPLLEEYHDLEWGVPVHDDRRHFEFLVLEAAQAGLSWLTVLRKREGYRRAFRDFDVAAVACLRQAEVDELLSDPGIIRNRQKIESSVSNARAVLEVQQEFGSFDQYLWRFVDGRPVVGGWDRVEQLPAETPLSKAVSKDMRARGFRFVGPVVIYSHLQATGIVMDHVRSCPRYAGLAVAG